jgi:hypothetical protein
MTAKRGPGRPSTGIRIHVHVPPDVLARIDGRAIAEDTTRADVIRQLLDAC